ncbi:cell wall synthase accessory phosphoprotein MacP [Carnobacterium divergens]|nr:MULTISPECIES: cell wall synthase accessory phosphoprotein MacP [Carnobacterium]MDT1941603.1 cell wall synthase accessory phosphoprotein MacP [Carnobacterium divergens]MDV8933148.1 cell wall synthase accessory phosphoprotein MacP [Carnobacterium sp.]
MNRYMSKPEMTRTELKKLKEQEEKDRKKRDKERLKVEKEYQKQLEKEGQVTKSRVIENEKSRETGRFLTKAILIVAVLLAIVLAIVFLV